MYLEKFDLKFLRIFCNTKIRLCHKFNLLLSVHEIGLKYIKKAERLESISIIGKHLQDTFTDMLEDFLQINMFSSL